jgi:hypothetical protein
MQNSAERLLPNLQVVRFYFTQPTLCGDAPRAQPMHHTVRVLIASNIDERVRDSVLLVRGQAVFRKNYRKWPRCAIYYVQCSWRYLSTTGGVLSNALSE